MVRDPPFSLNRPRYDDSKFVERARHFFEVTDPRTLLVSHTELRSACSLLQSAHDGSLAPGTSNAQLWEARRLKDSAYHPVTGCEIPRPFRFAAFVPVTLLVVPVMLLPSTIASPLRTVGVHWLNQSYLAAVNFANRSGGDNASSATLFKAYVGAVFASCSIALSATVLTKRMAAAGSSPAIATALRATLPFAAVTVAGSLNVAVMRQTELADGVDVRDHGGQVHGKSAVAGRVGVAKCCVTRGLWNAPIMCLHPLLMARLNRRPIFQRNPRAALLADAVLFTGILSVSVPLALGAFPQRDRLDASSLEPRFHNKLDTSGEPVQAFFYNKGL